MLLWDIYNEPGNRGIFATGTQEVQYDAKLETCAHELMKLAFQWVREEDPTQPLTVCAWRLPPEEERARRSSSIRWTRPPHWRSRTW